jgi:calcium and integrin-binding protein 1
LDPETCEAVDANPLELRQPLRTLYTMPELQFNPFRDRICAVFSTSDVEDGSMCFEDFLDMASGKT